MFRGVSLGTVRDKGRQNNKSARGDRATKRKIKIRMKNWLKNMDLATAVIGCCSTATLAQDGNRPDPEQFRQRMAERMREQFGVTDDAEWKIIEGKIQKVTEARRAAGGGGFAMGGFGGRRGGPGGDGNRGERGGGGAGGGGEGRRGGFGGE